MIKVKTAVRTPPTFAVSFFSFEQVLGGGAVVATAAVGSLVGLGVWSWRVALKVVVIWGASSLLQQLFVSSAPRQQYVPESHVCSCHAFTGLRPRKSLETKVS